MKKVHTIALALILVIATLTLNGCTIVSFKDFKQTDASPTAKPTPTPVPTIAPYAAKSEVLIDVDALLEVVRSANADDFSAESVDTSFCSYILNRTYLSELCKDNNDYTVLCTDIYTVFATSTQEYDIPEGMNVNSKDVVTIIRAIADDCPELFNVDTKYTYSLTDDDVLVSLDFMYKISHEKYTQYLTEVYDVIEEWSTPLSDLSNFDKELALYNKIIDTCSYSVEADHRRSVYGAIVLGEALCEGYSHALTAALQYNGIPATQVGGEAVDPATGEKEMHAWNYVCIDGYYYQADPTWDDYDPERITASKYTYFNVSDEFMRGYRTANEKYDGLTLPTCSHNSYNYYTKNGLIVSVDTDIDEYFNESFDEMCANVNKTQSQKQLMRVKFETAEQYEYVLDNLRSMINNWNDDAKTYRIKSYSYSPTNELNILLIVCDFTAAKIGNRG